MSKKIPAWTEVRTQELASLIGSETPVSNETVALAAKALETTTRSIAAKLRNLDIAVAPVENVREKTFSDEQEESLRSFVENNTGKYTYAEIASAVNEGSHDPRQVQGKILSMELTSHVKPTEKKEFVKKYNDEEEQKIIALMKKEGVFLEDIAKELNRELKSIRGKCLSLSGSDDSLKIPAQRDHVSKDNKDALTDLGDVSDLSVEDIATKIDKTPRGVKAMLTKRGIKCANYNGEARRAKADKKAENKD